MVTHHFLCLNVEILTGGRWLAMFLFSDHLKQQTQSDQKRQCF